MKYLLFFCLITLTLVESVKAQPAFWDEIQNFKRQDSASIPPKHAILFVGSSSFRMWADVKDYFPGYTIINRGFGGSTLTDVIRYAEDIIFPYEPSQVVIYCGENDVASGTVDSKEVAERFKKLFILIREKMSEVPIVFVSMKPSPSRAKFAPIVLQGNQIIKNFLWQQKNCVYVDVYESMLGPNGKPVPELFKSDSLHMTPKGYAIWQKLIQPHLLKPNNN